MIHRGSACPAFWSGRPWCGTRPLVATRNPTGCARLRPREVIPRRCVCRARTTTLPGSTGARSSRPTQRVHGRRRWDRHERRPRNRPRWWDRRATPRERPASGEAAVRRPSPAESAVRLPRRGDPAFILRHSSRSHRAGRRGSSGNAWRCATADSELRRKLPADLIKILLGSTARGSVRRRDRRTDRREPRP